MSDRLKDIVKTIEKIAQAVPSRSKGSKSSGEAKAKGDGKGGTPSAPGKMPVPTKGQTTKTPAMSPGVVGSPAIRTMQKAIQTFANAAVAYQTKTVKDSKGKIVKQVSEDDPRRNFNDFLAEQFSAGAEIRGDEFSSDPTATTKDSKQPTDLIQLNNVIDSLRRIGPGSKESLPDGRWEFRTNNAVRNIYALATALVSANEALGGAAPNDPRVFRRSDLVKLKNAIPKEKDPTAAGVPQTELATKAAEITPLVEKLTEFYNHYSKSIMNHPAYKRYITDDIPLLTVQPGQDPAQLDTDQAERMKNSQQIALPYLRLQDKDNRPINIDGRVLLSYLQNRQGLQKLMIDLLGYQPNEVNNGAAMRRTVKRMVNRINKIIDANKPPPATAKLNVPPVNQLQPSKQVADKITNRNMA